MTFYEAAVQVLLQAGHPLHAKEIAEIAIRENLLSHVGKEPEVTMAARLAAMARRSHDGRLIAVEPDTFGLTDWNLVAQPEALEQSGKPEVHDEEEPPLRERERHPRVDAANVRVSGRGERRRKHEEHERKKKKRLPPAAELVFELVGKVGKPLPLFDLAAVVREKELVGDDLGREGLAALLAAENERREDEGRRPIFAFHDDGLVGLHAGAGPATEPQDYPALIAQALARIAEERRAPPAAAAVAVAAKVSGAVERAVEEQRQRAIRQLRKRLGELEAGALESLVGMMLAEMGYRDVKVAKRHKDGALLLTRRRMGLTEVRFAVRVIKGGRDVRREEIADLRKDMASHAAQMGVVVSPSDPTREARNEASNAQAPLVTLLCADALADQLAERGIGVATRTVRYVDFDESAFRSALRRPAAPAEAEGEPQAKKGGATAEERRERRERERKEWRERREKAREERRRQKIEAEAAATAEGGGAGEGAPATTTEAAPADALSEAAHDFSLDVTIEDTGHAGAEESAEPRRPRERSEKTAEPSRSHARPEEPTEPSRVHTRPEEPSSERGSAEAPEPSRAHKRPEEPSSQPGSAEPTEPSRAHTRPEEPTEPSSQPAPREAPEPAGGAEGDGERRSTASGDDS